MFFFKKGFSGHALYIFCLHLLDFFRGSCPIKSFCTSSLKYVILYVCVQTVVSLLFLKHVVSQDGDRPVQKRMSKATCLETGEEVAVGNLPGGHHQQ